MSLYDLPKEMLIKIIEKIERPMYILKVRNRDSNRHYNSYIHYIGPFYSDDEIGEYFRNKCNNASFNVLRFKKHKSHYYLDCEYELHELTLQNIQTP